MTTEDRYDVHAYGTASAFVHDVTREEAWRHIRRLQSIDGYNYVDVHRNGRCVYETIRLNDEWVGEKVR